MNPLAQLLASAVMPQVPPQAEVAPGLPDLLSRSRFPPNMLPPGIEVPGPNAPLLNADRSRFPPGMLEALGLGAARIR